MSSTRGLARPACNDCNEEVVRLAAVAENALRNRDVHRAFEILGRLQRRAEAKNRDRRVRRGNCV